MCAEVHDGVDGSEMTPRLDQLGRLVGREHGDVRVEFQESVLVAVILESPRSAVLRDTLATSKVFHVRITEGRMLSH
jgi:hypothetical protein